VGKVSAFRTGEARRAYVDAYDRALAASPVPVEERDVDTPFGRTHVLTAGTADAPSLVLLHGKTTSSTMWLDLLPGLVEHRRVFLVDTVGDLNKSEATRPLRNTVDVVAWIDSVLSGLDVERAAFGGLSYGAWMATTYAMARPQRVDRLIVISPAGVFSWVRPTWIARAMYTHMIRPRPDSLQRFARTLFMPETYEQMNSLPYAVVLDQYFVGMSGFKMASREAMPSVYKPSRLAALTMPTMVVIGENETVCNGAKAAAKARRSLPQARVELLANANHMVNVDRRDELAGLLKEFFAEAD
jgi:pimeloyl-ACP methyl ester carboxylesterase